MNNGRRRPVALVTGGATRIGRFISERLIREGYAVAVHTRMPSPEADRALCEIKRQGGSAALVHADLSDQSAVSGIIPRVKRELGPVALLVNNASLFEPDHVGGLDPILWDRHFTVNLRTPCFLMQDMALNFEGDLPGCVVNIVDQRVWRLTPLFSSYTLSKAALWAATQTFAQALAPSIRVNAIGPGPTLGNSRQDPDLFRKQAESLPLTRSVAAADIAETVVFLSRSASVTGQMIAVDGGQHLAWRTPDALLDG